MLLGLIDSLISDPELAALPEAYYDQEKYENKEKVIAKFHQ